MGRGRCSQCGELCPEGKSEEPVCASDNATYASECAMREAACSSGVLLEVKHSGSCNCKCGCALVLRGQAVPVPGKAPRARRPPSQGQATPSPGSERAA